MEDVKELYLRRFLNSNFQSFNPCFNGRCKRTKCWIDQHSGQNGVSILVLMEDVKELGIHSVLKTMQRNVSILVLMEDVKELAKSLAPKPESTAMFQSLF